MSERMQGGGGGTGQTLRDVLEELYGRSTGNTSSTSLEIRMSEAVPPALQETSDGIRQEGQKEAQVRRGQERGPRRSRLYKSLNYWQRTEITGEDPLNGPG